MKIARAIMVAVLAIPAFTGIAWAQTAQGDAPAGQSACMDRQQVDSSGCVIQDGPPHRVYPLTRPGAAGTGNTGSSGTGTSSGSTTTSTPGYFAPHKAGGSR